MLTETQRGLLDGLIGGMPDDVASAVCAALDEIDAARAAQLDVEAAKEDVEACVPSEPEVYTYWIVFQDYSQSGSFTWESERISRSTPLLTWEDLETLRGEMRDRRHAADVKIVDYKLLKG
jgi:hypothetical protein